MARKKRRLTRAQREAVMRNLRKAWAARRAKARAKREARKRTV